MFNAKVERLKAATQFVGEEAIFTGDLAIVAAGYSRSNPTLSDNLRQMAARYRGLVKAFESNELDNIVLSASVLRTAMEQVDKQAFTDWVLDRHKVAIEALRDALAPFNAPAVTVEASEIASGQQTAKTR